MHIRCSQWCTDIAVMDAAVAASTLPHWLYGGTAMLARLRPPVQAPILPAQVYGSISPASPVASSPFPPASHYLTSGGVWSISSESSSYISWRFISLCISVMSHLELSYIYFLLYLLISEGPLPSHLTYLLVGGVWSISSSIFQRSRYFPQNLTYFSFGGCV